MKKAIVLFISFIIIISLILFKNDNHNFMPIPIPDNTIERALSDSTNVSKEYLNLEKEHDLSENGAIVGEVLYNNIEISQLFVEPFINVLGQPLNERGASSYYEGLLIVGSQGHIIGYDNMAIQINGFDLHLNLLEINDFSLNTSRAEMMDVFGVPYNDNDYIISYVIVNPVVKYRLILRFDNIDNDNVTSVTMIIY